MFFKYLDFIFVPFRAINNKILGVKNVKGSVHVDVNRVKALKARGTDVIGEGRQKFQQHAGQPHAGQPHAGQPHAGQPHAGQPHAGQPHAGQPHAGQPHAGQVQQGAQGMQQAGGQGAPSGTPGEGGAPDSNPPIRAKGFWIFKKKFCTQCEQQLDKSWDACPFCAQIAAQVLAAPAKKALKTQAFVLDAQGGPGSMQLLGWIVALQGPHKGELFTLSPVSTIGTDPTCTVVLVDKFMSAKHAQIKAEAGMWVLVDSGSTNGTYVNNRRVERHELIDNDFVKFGAAMFKFKSL